VHDTDCQQRSLGQHYFRVFASATSRPQAMMPHPIDTASTISPSVIGLLEFEIALNEKAKIRSGARISALHGGNFSVFNLSSKSLMFSPSLFNPFCNSQLA
jgi:hypothetical protein